MIERVATAIDGVQLWSRFNDWTSDRVAGCPIEICRYGGEGEEEIVVSERFGGAITEGEALRMVVSKARARAAIEAMREPTDAMEKAGNAGLSRNGLDSVEGDDSTSAWQAMIDTALAEPQP